MQKGEQGKDGSRQRPGQMWSACGLPKPVPRRRWKRYISIYTKYIVLACRIIIWFLPDYLLPLWVRFLGAEICCALWLPKFCNYDQIIAIVGDHPHLKCLLLWATYANVPSHYHAQGIKEMGAGQRHRQLCRPCLGLMAACTRTWHG